MFIEKVDLKLKSWDFKLDYIKKNIPDIDEILLKNGVEGVDILMRGGFNSVEDLDSILKYGWDYEGRAGKEEEGDFLYASPLWNMDLYLHNYDVTLCPFWHIYEAIYLEEGAPALVLYDNSQFEKHSDPNYDGRSAYCFKNPDKKKESVLGVICINVLEE